MTFDIRKIFTYPTLKKPARNLVVLKQFVYG